MFLLRNYALQAIALLLIQLLGIVIAGLDPKTGGLGLSLGGAIAWVGDFNNDKRSDVFVIKPNGLGGEYVDVYLWSSNDPDRAFSRLDIDPSNSPKEDSPIVGIIVSDLNHDGKLDVITFTRAAKSDQTESGLVGKIWLGNLVNFFPGYTSLPGVMRDLPLAFDANNDLKVDFLAESVLKGKTEGARSLWVWKSNQKKSISVSLQKVLKDVLIEQQHSILSEGTLGEEELKTMSDNGLNTKNDSPKSHKISLHAYETVLTPEVLNLLEEVFDAILDDTDMTMLASVAKLDSNKAHVSEKGQEASKSAYQAILNRADSYLRSRSKLKGKAITGLELKATGSGDSMSITSSHVELSVSVPEYEIIEMPLPNEVKTNHPRLRVPSTSATVDLNGDCKSDLVVVSTPSKASRDPVVSNAWIDEDTESVLELWLNVGQKGTPTQNTYAFKQAYPLPKGAGQLVFHDFNSDGTVDIAFPVCWPVDSCKEENSMRVIYNIQRPLCSSPLNRGGSSCRAHDKMCIADPAFSFGDFNPVNSDKLASDAFKSFLDAKSKGETSSMRSSFVDTVVNDYVADALEHLKITEEVSSLEQLTAGAGTGLASESILAVMNSDTELSLDKDVVQSLQYKSVNGASVTIPSKYFEEVNRKFGVYAPFGEGKNRKITEPPLTLRIGDVDMDGYSDILIPLRVADAPNSPIQFEIWKNVPCAVELGCTQESVNRGDIRTFVRTLLLPALQSNAPAKEGASDEAVPSCYAATFIDYNNQGTLDVLVLTLTESDDLKKGGAMMFLNSLDSDAYFLTVMGSNGVCPAWCKSGPEFPKPKPYGAAHPGASFKFTVTALNGRKAARQIAQLPTSTYLTLQTPYTLTGLGRTNNYVEQFYAGYTLPGSHYNLWVAMIPNSQLVVFPYPHGSPSSWLLELFMLPSTKLLHVGIAYVVTLTLIGITIGILHVRERKEDEAEKRSDQQLFAF